MGLTAFTAPPIPTTTSLALTAPLFLLLESGEQKDRRSPPTGGQELSYTVKPPRARNVFDGMARRSRAKRAPRPGGQDLISTLPDGVLQHVFGFLPADEAVRTSVLAPRWLRLWRSMGRLRIVSAGRWRSVDDFNEFVDRLLLRREPNLVLTRSSFR
nr:putative FBD-associated F-box protein At1g78730 [Setaria viridis]